jgi:hypothetical protein
VLQARFGLAQKLRQCALALLNRALAQVLAIQLQEVEGVDCGDPAFTDPTTGIPRCCASAVSGRESEDTAKPPSSVMNSRRFTRSPRGRPGGPEIEVGTVGASDREDSTAWYRGCCALEAGDTSGLEQRGGLSRSLLPSSQPAEHDTACQYQANQLSRPSLRKSERCEF